MYILVAQKVKTESYQEKGKHSETAFLLFMGYVICWAVWISINLRSNHWIREWRLAVGPTRRHRVPCSISHSPNFPSPQSRRSSRVCCRSITLVAISLFLIVRADRSLSFEWIVQHRWIRYGRFFSAVANVRNSHRVKREGHTTRNFLIIHRLIQTAILHKLSQNSGQRQIPFRTTYALLYQVFPRPLSSSQNPTSGRVPRCPFLNYWAWQRRTSRLIQLPSIPQLMKVVNWTSQLLRSICMLLL